MQRMIGYVAVVCVAAGLTGCTDNPFGEGQASQGDPIRWKQIVLDGYPFSDYACGLSEAGRTYCWGSTDTGYPGSVCKDGSRTPVELVDAPKFDALDAAWTYTCGITPTHEVFCWGGITSQVNADVPMTVATPTRVDADVQFTKVAAATGFRCGLSKDAEIYCWNWRDRTPALLPT